MKAVNGGFNFGKDRESSCNHLVGPMKLVQACLSIGKVRCSRFCHCRGPVKAVSISGKVEKAVFTPVEVK